jgi:hypothetical protein
MEKKIKFKPNPVPVSKRLKISQLTVSQSATRGEKIVQENKLKRLQNK